MSDELRQENSDIVLKFIENNKTNNCSYMLTIARDGESPVRSIYIFDNIIDAVKGYERYTDWGFAKEFLTVSLYEPGGKITTKILKRPRGGECTFVKNDYIEAEKILLSIKEYLNKEQYKRIVNEFAQLFSKDNIRFDTVRFFKKTGTESFLD